MPKVPSTFGLEDAPNILLVLIDDCGYGQMSTFGGGIPTPVMDRVAANGLRYTHFHTTALCSPTRAALLTGRNHHSVASGVIGEAGTGFPGYSGIIPASAATFAEVLREYGYSNAWFGKNHNVPDWETSIVGPFDRWASGLGFDSAGNIEAFPRSRNSDIKLAATFADSGLQATGIEVQQGATQRSFIRTVDVLFSSEIGLNSLLAAGRIAVERFAPNATNVDVGTGVPVTDFSLDRIRDRLRLGFDVDGITSELGTPNPTRPASGQIAAVQKIFSTSALHRPSLAAALASIRADARILFG